MNTKVNERLWWAVKTLLKGGSMVKDAADYFEISQNTVSRINQSASFEEYKNIISAAHVGHQKKRRLPEKPVEDIKPVAESKISEKQKEPEKTVEPKQTIIYKPTWEMQQEIQKTNVLLTSISAKLAFIVEELCGVAKKEE